MSKSIMHEIRGKLGFTLKEMGKHLGVSGSAAYCYENKIYAPNAEVYKKLGELLKKTHPPINITVNDVKLDYVDHLIIDEENA